MILYSSITENGDRITNEDAIAVQVFSNGYGFILCDGLGGHGMGEIASTATVHLFETYTALIKAVDPQNMHAFFSKAQNNLCAIQEENHSPNRYKTTAVGLLLEEKKACLGHIGDSRGYIFDRTSLLYQTVDHSVPAALARAGRISEEEIRYHPDRNKVLKVLGMETENFCPSVTPVMHFAGFRAFLLCSDGFWENITEQQMADALRNANSPEIWLDNMRR